MLVAGTFPLSVTPGTVSSYEYTEIKEPPAEPVEPVNPEVGNPDEGHGLVQSAIVAPETGVPISDQPVTPAGENLCMVMVPLKLAEALTGAMRAVFVALDTRVKVLPAFVNVPFTRFSSFVSEVLTSSDKPAALSRVML